MPPDAYTQALSAAKNTGGESCVWLGRWSQCETAVELMSGELFKIQW